MADTRTPEERVLGRRQKFVHSGIDPRVFGRNYGRDYNALSSKNPEPAPFGKRDVPKGQRRSVSGGRWGVRKLAAHQSDGRHWLAYNRNSLKTLSAKFDTQAEAMGHAQKCARLASVAMLRREGRYEPPTG